jgi:hypothetical protein
MDVAELRDRERHTLAALSFIQPLHAQGWIIRVLRIIRPMDERLPRPIVDCRPDIAYAQRRTRRAVDQCYSTRSKSDHQRATIGEVDYLSASANA